MPKHTGSMRHSDLTRLECSRASLPAMKVPVYTRQSTTTVSDTINCLGGVPLTHRGADDSLLLWTSQKAMHPGSALFFSSMPTVLRYGKRGSKVPLYAV